MNFTGNSQEMENSELKVHTTELCKKRIAKNRSKPLLDLNEPRWGRLWKARAHPRVINYVWRVLNNSLPTRLNLQKRGVNCIALCPRCWKKKETEHHLLKECEFARCFWFHSQLGIRTSDFLDLDIRKWIEELLDKLDMDLQGLLCTSILHLWVARNEVLHEEVDRSPMEVADRAMKNFKEYQKALTVIEDVIHPPPLGSQSVEFWRRPPTHKLKINVDASCIDEETVGIGAVARDSEGTILMSGMWKVNLSIKSHEAEALACLMGLERARKCCFFDIIVKSDNIEVIQSLREKRIQSNYLSTFIVDCLHLIPSFRSVEFSHVKRNGNRITHELANMALTTPNTMWMEEAPQNICNMAWLERLGPIHE
ncbi:uncharacterized protein LOC107469042 [Arachis duranensis]|uniref:Uncharacterized protein LOC107469042 n=1 Tax=Arachis duranensis TaxID=130453 RepID=A0A6P4C591_ARADU|nr:uncharacterized protein LOC107469042 [Arachis duranensis]